MPNKIQIPLNLVNDFDDIIKPGDACVVAVTKKIPLEDGIHFISSDIVDYYQLIICCPRCGKKSASAGNHKYDKETKSYHPSIVHDTELGGCGWHGWLKDGIFKEC